MSPETSASISPSWSSDRSKRRSRSVALAFIFIASFALFTAALCEFTALYDGDSYFHLAVARRYLRGEIRGGLAWARLSVMSEGFGDKEILFHLMLAPFTLIPGSLGGKLALAALNAGIVTMLAWLAAGAIGRIGYAVPFLCLLGSAHYLDRCLRLRPELFSLLLLLWATRLAVTRRFLLLFAAAGALTLSHTGFGVLLALCALWLLYERYAEHRWIPDLLLKPVLGVGLALLIHPQFPANVQVWIYQNVLRYVHKLPDAGREFTTISLFDAVMLNAGWWLGLVMLRRSVGPRARNESALADRSAAYFGIGAVVFALLFLWLARFALYLVPFCTLTVVFVLQRRGLRPPAWAALSRRKRLPIIVGLLAIAALSARSLWMIGGHLRRQGIIGSPVEAEARLLAAAVPEGAQVAATWQDAELYVFWVPQAEYLNVLDPIFIAAYRPEAYRRLLSIFGGAEPDVPLRVGLDLASDYVAASFPVSATVRRRLAQDPRAILLFSGHHVLYGIRPNANTDFILDWQVVPQGTPPPSSASGVSARWARYPRSALARGRALEGFVDASRLRASDDCPTLTHVEWMPEAGRVDFELAAYGPATIWIDCRYVVQQLDAQRAILGAGVRLSVELARGGHVITVRTCRAHELAGFYLLKRKVEYRSQGVGG